MRPAIIEFVKICSETLSLAEPIYEFGSLQVEGQEGFADIRPLFPGINYVGADLRPGRGVDVCLDIQNINLPHLSVGTILVLDTLEHVAEPRDALLEAHRVLKQSGTIIISSVLNFPIHNHPSDYWRFTTAGLHHLLKPFCTSFVSSSGDPNFPHTVIGIGWKSPITGNSLAGFHERFNHWK